MANQNITEWQKKLPMHMTMARIYLVPFVLLSMWPNTLLWNVLAIFLFIIASITDYYDGYFARKYNAVSNMGKFMDPIADKVLVTSILVMLQFRGVIDPVMVIILMARDTFIGGIRSVAAADNVIISAKSAGKWKTALQMGAIPALIINDLPHFYQFPLLKIGYAILWVTVILSVFSGIQYYLAYLSARKSN